MLEEFEAHLRRSNLSENTISSYLLTIRMYQQLPIGVQGIFD